jgi:hypothetical protein
MFHPAGRHIAGCKTATTSRENGNSPGRGVCPIGIPRLEGRPLDLNNRSREPDQPQWKGVVTKSNLDRITRFSRSLLIGNFAVMQPQGSSDFAMGVDRTRVSCAAWGAQNACGFPSRKPHITAPGECREKEIRESEGHLSRSRWLDHSSRSLSGLSNCETA